MDILSHEKQIFEYLKTIDHLKQQNQESPLFNAEISKLEVKLEELKHKVYSDLTPWQRVMICRHPQRPRSVDFIRQLCDPFFELHGDRYYRDDPAIVGGLAKIDGMKCVIIGQEKGNDTESRVKRNFGMLHPEGFRKAMRLIRLAEKFQLPVISLLDTPGAYPGLEAEERGQGWAIANNLKEMFSITTPIIVVVIGEGCSGGALGMGIGDVVGMLQHAYYSVISPEGCASILWKDASKNSDAAAMLKLHAEHLKAFELVDSIIEEPLGGAHHDPLRIFVSVKDFILKQWDILKTVPTDKLLQHRYQKFRKMGKFSLKTRVV